MIFAAIAAASLLLFLVPWSVGALARGISAYSAASSWMFGVSVQNAKVPDFIASLGAYVNYSPDILGAEVTSALAVLVVAGLASLLPSSAKNMTHRQSSQVVIPRLVRYVVLAIGTGLAIYVVLSIGVDRLISYTGYGSIKDTDAVFGENAFGRIAAGTLRFSTIALIAISIVSLNAGNRGYFLWALIPISLAFAVSISEAGRVTAIYFGTAAVTFIVLRKQFRAGVFSVLALLSLAYALEARSNVDLGLAHAPSQLVESLSSTSIENVVLNVSGGLFVTSASARVAMADRYSETYKLLSFLPTVDAIDGFQIAKSANEQRIRSYIPFNAHAEAFLFGPIYFILYWSIIVFSLIFVYRSSKFGNIAFLVSTVIFAYAWTISTQYPVRNSMRLFYFIFVLYFVLTIVRGWVRGPRRSPQVAIR